MTHYTGKLNFENFTKIVIGQTLAGDVIYEYNR